MRLPKPENWTLRTSERLISRLWVLYDVYEKNVGVNSERADRAYSEGLSLQDSLPVDHARILKFKRIFH